MRLSKLSFGAVGVACVMVVGMGASPAWGQCVPAPSGLVSWWDADSVSGTTAFDIQGGNDGTLQNGATFAPGLVGQAFSFDGVNDHILVGTASVNNNQGTVDAWVLHSDTSTFQDNMVVGTRTDAGDRLYLSFIRSGTYHIGLGQQWVLLSP